VQNQNFFMFVLIQDKRDKMETLEAIKTRRSIRKFTSKKISDDILRKIIEAGMYAPSARDTQSWHFIVIDERRILNELPHLHPYAEMMYEAQHAILICGDLNLENLVEYNGVNCSAATQNMMLAAHDLGVGSVWLGIYPRTERMEPLTKLFELPEHIVPMMLIALGYPNESPKTPERFKQERIHTNRW
jgi:nitroreductase